MKTFIFTLVIIGLTFTACKKSAPVTIPFPPTVASVNPVMGPVNTVVTITGTNFSTTPTDNTVKFNGVAATVSSATATSITVTAPAAGTTGKITVSTANGMGTGPVFTYVVVLPPPTVTAISPVSGGAATVVTITGTNFKTTASDNTVKFNGVAATVQTATATTLTVLSPAAGTTGAVTVTTVDGTATGPVFTYTSDVYVVGKGITGWGYWKNGVFVAMPSNCVEGWSVFVNGADVYIAGADINTGGPAYWKNGTTVDLPMTAGHNGGRAVSIFVSGTDVYAAGWDFINGGNTLPRCWKNGTAVTVSLSTGNIGGQPVSTATANSVFVSGSDLYLAGIQTASNGVTTYWKNGSPVTLTDGTTDCQPDHIFVSGSDVYVAGTDGTVSKYWKNGVASILNTPNVYSAIPTGISVSGSDVYVSGYYRNVAKYWKNGNMVDLTSTAYNPANNEYATGISISGPDIYISGNDMSKGYGYWKNGVFTVLSGAGIVNGIFVQ
jgi:hypothetical protein